MKKNNKYIKIINIWHNKMYIKCFIFPPMKMENFSPHKIKQQALATVEAKVQLPISKPAHSMHKK